MSDLPSKLKLAYNPFEPAATGPPFGAPLSVPDTTRNRATEIIETLQTGTGVKALVVVGEYGPASRACSNG